jgi:hypothetical protein
VWEAMPSLIIFPLYQGLSIGMGCLWASDVMTSHKQLLVLCTLGPLEIWD